MCICYSTVHCFTVKNISPYQQEFCKQTHPILKCCLSKLCLLICFPHSEWWTEWRRRVAVLRAAKWGRIPGTQWHLLRCKMLLLLSFMVLDLLFTGHKARHRGADNIKGRKESEGERNDSTRGRIVGNPSERLSHNTSEGFDFIPSLSISAKRGLADAILHSVFFFYLHLTPLALLFRCLSCITTLMQMFGPITPSLNWGNSCRSQMIIISNGTSLFLPTAQVSAIQKLPNVPSDVKIEPSVWNRSPFCFPAPSCCGYEGIYVCLAATQCLTMSLSQSWHSFGARVKMLVKKAAFVTTATPSLGSRLRWQLGV